MYEANHLAALLRKESATHGDEAFLRTADGEVLTTFDGFFANAERLARVLVESGLQPGDRVAVQAPKTVIMLELYVATILAGGVFLPLNTAYTAAEVTYFLNDATPRIVVVTDATRDALGLIAKDAGAGAVFTINADESGTLADARAQETAGFSPVARGSSDLGAILYTSGTTGRSKGAMLSHGALASNSATLVDFWRFSRDDVLIHALPVFHTHGLFVATNVALMSGASCVFLPGFDAAAIIKAMPHATALMGVPTFYTRLLTEADLPAASRNMRLFISGSAPLLAETHDQWRAKTGHAILERYGMTETNMNTSNPYDGERRAGTVGHPLPGVELKITDPASGADLKQGEIGMIEVRGPNVFSGYWQMPEKTAEELRDDGFFITGDLGRIDADGYVHIVGRQKDLIISGGFNIYPKEIEGMIDDLPGVNESAVIGVPHPDFGEGVIAVVVPIAGQTLSADQVIAGLDGQLARFKQPKRVIIADDLPRNTMGKVQKNVLRHTYGDVFTGKG